MTRVAAIDCGTNSLRLLVADLDQVTGVGVDVLRRMEIVRLGEDVDRTRRLSPEGLERTFAVLRDYRAVLDALGADHVRMVATSATRDAANKAEFIAGVEAILGAAPQVISGADEAALSFAGATAELPCRGIPAPYLVVDIGGGSTELVLGERSVTASRSVDVGCVRLTERHLHDDPPLADQVVAARADIEAGLAAAAADVPLGAARTVVAVAGTATTVAAVALGLPEYDAERIHLSRLSAADVRRVSYALRTMSRAERAALPVMHPGRVDVIAAGALVLEAVVDRSGATSVVVSEHDILDGLAWSCLPNRHSVGPTVLAHDQEARTGRAARSDARLVPPDHGY